MKKILLILLGTCYFLTTQAQIQKVEIIATGLTCSMCSNAIQKQIKTLPEVVKVDIDLNKNMFVVQLKNNNNISPVVLKDKVEKAGFFVGEMNLFINFSNVKVEDKTAYQNFMFIDTKPQVLNGVQKVKLLDKGYVTAKELKKLGKQYAQYSSYGSNKTIFHIKTV
jgi:copper chaperone CopZ